MTLCVCVCMCIKSPRLPFPTLLIEVLQQLGLTLNGHQERSHTGSYCSVSWTKVIPLYVQMPGTYCQDKWDLSIFYTYLNFQKSLIRDFLSFDQSF